MEWALTTAQAQIRPYIRERWRADLFQSPTNRIEQLSRFRVRSLPPLSFSTLYLLIPLHNPEERSLCTGAGRRTEAERWIWLRVT